MRVGIVWVFVAIVATFAIDQTLVLDGEGKSSKTVAPTGPPKEIPCQEGGKVVCPACPPPVSDEEKEKPTALPKAAVVVSSLTPPDDIDEAAKNMAVILDAGMFDVEKHWDLTFSKFVNKDDERDRVNYDKNTRPTLQRLYWFIKSTIFDAKQREPRDAFPVFGILMTNIDFPMAQNLLVHLDLPVKSYCFVVNGDSNSARIYLTAIQILLGKDAIHTIFNKENIGVAGGWNQVVRHGIDSRKEPYVVLSNSDVVPFSSLLMNYARESWDHADKAPVIRFAHFALFSYTRFGVKSLGYFDENIFPAYTEDVEIHVRAVSRGLGGRDHFRLSGNNEVNQVFWHLTSPNRAHDPKIQAGFNAMNKEGYLMQKWGISLHGTVDFAHSRPFGHPFNNDRIPHNNSWILDVRNRQCIKEGRDCGFDTSLLKQLEV